MSRSEDVRKSTIFIRQRSCKVIVGLLAIVLLFAAAPAHAFLARPAVFAALGTVVKAPTGWQQFCKESPEECRPAAETPREITLTPDLLQQLFRINGYVNDRVKWVSDEELYGKSEHWAYPLDRGDCEDIVLLKRRLLARAGWPLSTLLITTAEERNDDKGRHAVLTVRTDRGELILDNQTPEILFWHETNYRYLARQSTTDPNIWVSFDGRQPSAAAPPVR